MNTPKLIPIDMSKSNGHYHPDINNKDTYLCLIGDVYHCGKFSKQWYGWSFFGWYGTSLQFDTPDSNSSEWQQIWKIQE